MITKQIKRWLRLTALVPLLVVLTACPATSPQTAKLEPIIPETTKVPDQATRDLLTVYDADTGIMRFSASTPILANLKPDDVLVSEPSAAAPNGYLRKVKAIRQEGSEVVLETTQANLTDAIHRGSLEATADLEATDLVAATPLVEGLSVGLVKSTSNNEVGDNFDFEARFDETIVLNGDGNITLRVNGVLYFKAGYYVGIDIDSCFELPPVCLERFEAWMGFEQKAQLQVSGEANAKLTEERKVAEYRFEPQCFPIGPVPVCVVPTVYVFIGVTGEVNLRFNYNALQTAQARIGFKWTDDDGWADIVPEPGFDTSLDKQFDINAGLTVRAYAKAEGALMIFGLTGPTLGIKLSVELDAAIPRDPFWIVRGGIEAYYGFIVDLPVIGRLAESSGTLYNITKEFARSPNSPPRIIVNELSKRIDLGQSVSLGFRYHDGGCTGIYCVFDPEEDIPSFTLTSDLDGSLAATTYTFANPGLRTITINTSDSHGASASGSFTVDVVNTPPTIFVTGGGGAVKQTVPYFLSAAATDPNTKLDCSALNWSVESPDMIEAANVGTTGCYGKAVFNVKGQRTVSVVARDPQGAASPVRTFSVEVTDPPLNPSPTIVQPLSIKGRYTATYDNAEIPEGSTVVFEYGERVFGNLELSVKASDPEGEPLTYNFWGQCFNCNGELVYPFFIGSNQTGEMSYTPPISAVSDKLTKYQIGVNVTDGTISIPLVRTFLVGFVPRGPR